MNLRFLLEKSFTLVKANSPEILTGLGVAGVVTTSYLVGKASYVASEIVHSNEAADGTSSDPKQRFKERFHHTWRLYVPAGISGALTIGCIIGASKSHSKRTAAAVAAYSLTEQAFSDYKEKVIEQFNKNKEEKIRESIAQDRVNANPPSSREVILTGRGDAMCCELLTGRYFRSDMEALRKAMNDINHWVVNSRHASLSDFYDLIGLSATSVSAELGWDDERLMELKFTAVLTDDNEPCLAFEYNYTKPLWD